MPANGVSKLQFDNIEDTIEAFRMSIALHFLQYQKFQSPRDSQCISGSARLRIRSVASLKALWITADSVSQFLGNGEFIVVLDSQDRENEGDLIIAAEDVTTEKMAFMIRHTR